MAGTDLQESILRMLNICKDTLEIPEMIQTGNLAMVPIPGKKSIHDLENQRGVFLISIF